jgi:hypothetical protein
MDYQNYQNQLNQQYQQLQNMQQNQQRMIVDFVQGEASADVFPVNNGQRVFLFDIDNPYVYKKERDMNGTLIKSKFLLVEQKEEEPAKEKVDLTEYVKADDVAQMIADAVDKKMSEYTLKPTKKKPVAEEE